MRTAFLAQSMRPEFGEIRAVLAGVLAENRVTIVRVDELEAEPGLITQAIAKAISEADLMIVDVTDSNPNVMFEFGSARAREKPCLVISADVATLPLNLANYPVLVYDRDKPASDAFVTAFRDAIRTALKAPQRFRAEDQDLAAAPRSIIVSYSHRDKDVLDRLLVHLRPLERDGLIDVWNDQRIEAGADWKHEVEAALRNASVAILLVTADFLASDFIIENELPPLLEQAEMHGTRILPVIVKPCRYVRDRRRRRLQAINDPRTPLLMLTPVEQERVLDEVAEAVERATPAS